MLTLIDHAHGIYSLPDNDNISAQECHINGRIYRIYMTSYGLWTWRSGDWWDFGFRKGREYETPAAAQQAAIDDARAV